MIDIKLYLQVREKEGWIYSDEILRNLPDLPASHPLAAEWRMRAASCAGLVHYLAGLCRPLNILELGCGNGWLSHQLAGNPAARVIGVDVSGPELSQAARVFGRNRLAFIAADIFQPPLKPASFDIIVLASSIQYFPDLTALILALRPLLTARGEIHLLDSPLYPPDVLPAARARTHEYYHKLGFPAMTAFYYHHPTTALENFAPRWLYRPGRMAGRILGWLGKSRPPFPWIVLYRAALG